MDTFSIEHMKGNERDLCPAEVEKEEKETRVRCGYIIELTKRNLKRSGYDEQ